MRFSKAIRILWVLGAVLAVSLASIEIKEDEEDEIPHNRERRFGDRGGSGDRKGFGESSGFGGSLQPSTGGWQRPTSSDGSRRKWNIRKVYKGPPGIPRGDLRDAFKNYLIPTNESCAAVESSAPHIEARTRPNLSYYKCKSLNGTMGRCRPYRYCKLPEFFVKSVFIEYACTIPSTPATIGLCCPHKAPMPQSTPQDENSTTTEIDCGRPLIAQTNTRIVGGGTASPGEFPWIVSLMSMETYPLNFCGGSLITPWHVLTAAHCAEIQEVQTTTWIRLGEFDYSIEKETKYIDRRIFKFQRHPLYTRGTMENDLAILTLEVPVRYDDHIRPICLPPPPSPPPAEGDEETYAGKQAIVAGWGALAYQGRRSKTLQKVTVPVWSKADCKAAYTNGIKAHMMCAGSPEGGKDACQDDSGGPLVVQEGGKFSLIGIVSWGTSCALPGKPGVYTSVNRYLDWIDENTAF